MPRRASNRDIHHRDVVYPLGPHINGGKVSPSIRIDIETHTESRFRLP